MSPLKDDVRCTHVLETGDRCRRGRIKGKEFCFQHQYNSKDFEVAVSFLSNRLYLDSAEGIHFLLTQATAAVARGELQPRQATTIGYLAQVMLTSLSRMKEERHRIKYRKEDEAGEDRHVLREYLRDYVLYSNDWENAEEEDSKSDTESAVQTARDIQDLEVES